MSLGPVRTTNLGLLLLAGAGLPVVAVWSATAHAANSTTTGGIVLTRDVDIGARFGAPGPRTCSSATQPKTGPISAAQARAYVICGFEKDYQGGSENLFLLGHVQVQVAKGRPYEHVRDSLEGIDPHKLIYDIRGSSVVYSCYLPDAAPASNAQQCSRTVNLHDEGRCYQTTTAEWKCTWGDLSAVVSTDTRLRVPAPKETEVQ